MPLHNEPGEFPEVGDVLICEVGAMDMYEAYEAAGSKRSLFMSEMIRRSVRTVKGERFLNESDIRALTRQEFTRVWADVRRVCQLDEDHEGNSGGVRSDDS